MFDAFVTLGGAQIDAVEIIKGISKTFIILHYKKDLSLKSEQKNGSVGELEGNSVFVFRYSFILCGCLWRFPLGFCVRPADVLSDQMH